MAALRPGISAFLDASLGVEACFSGRPSYTNGAHVPSSDGPSARQQRRHSTPSLDPLTQLPRNLNSLGCLASPCLRRRGLLNRGRCPPQQAASTDETGSNSVPLAAYAQRDSTLTAFAAAAQRLEGLLSRVG